MSVGISHLIFVRFALLLSAMGGLLSSDSGLLGIACAQEQTSADPQVTDARAADRTAIRAAMDSFAKAFESRDAKALAAIWAEEGEYENEEGVSVRGRENLEKSFAAIFAMTPELTASVKPRSVRFLSRDSAIEEGLVTIRRGPTAAPTTAGYSALFVREDGKWALTQLHEVPDEEPTTVADLAWIVGEWKSVTGSGAEIQTTYSMSQSKKFINVRFSIKENEYSLSGSQVIGVDPATGQLHTWTFESDGGIGSADWNRDGDHWVLSASGTLANGTTITETNVVRRINDETFTWQSINRMLGDVPLPDLAPVKITRVKSAK